jgi:hypothetical protein
MKMSVFLLPFCLFYVKMVYVRSILSIYVRAIYFMAICYIFFHWVEIFPFWYVVPRKSGNPGANDTTSASNWIDRKPSL